MKILQKFILLTIIFFTASQAKAVNIDINIFHNENLKKIEFKVISGKYSLEGDNIKIADISKDESYRFRILGDSIVVEKNAKALGTYKFLKENNVVSQLLYWPDENQNPNSIEYIKNKKIDLVINIPKNLSKSELDNDYEIRRSAIDFNIPLITNSRLAQAFITAFCKKDLKDISIKSWDEY